MTNEEAITKLKEFGLHHAIKELPYSSQTVEAFDMAIAALQFKDYFDKLYGEGLEVINYHLNGDSEPFDTFYEDALETTI